MSDVALRAAVELGLIYSLVTAGLFLSYRILNLADLTVDGSFTLGAAASIMVSLGGHPWLGLLWGTVCGALAGFVTAFLQTKLRVQSILAGILTMTALYSVNLRVMDGRASVNIIGQNTIFTPFQALFGDWGRLALLALLAAGAMLLLTLFLNTRLGLSIRATGDNENMVRSSSINVNFTKTLGLVIANALVGLSGGLLGQYQQTSDASMGIGVVVIGLASLIIGEAVFGNLIYFLCKRRNMITGIVSVVAGSILYRTIIGLVIQYNNAPALQFLHVTASDMKLLSAIIVVAAISYPALRDAVGMRKKKGDLHRGRKNAGSGKEA